MWTMLEDFFHARLRGNPAVRAMLPAIERKVAEGALSPNLAVEQIVSALGLTH
jgi:LAO/AO transport system kinase